MFPLQPPYPSISYLSLSRSLSFMPSPSSHMHACTRTHTRTHAHTHTHTHTVLTESQRYTLTCRQRQAKRQRWEGREDKSCDHSRLQEGGKRVSERENRGWREVGPVDRGQLGHTWKKALTEMMWVPNRENLYLSSLFLCPPLPPPPLPPSATHPPAVSLSSRLFLSASMRLLLPPLLLLPPSTPFCALYPLIHALFTVNVWRECVCVHTSLCVCVCVYMCVLRGGWVRLVRCDLKTHGVNHSRRSRGSRGIWRIHAQIRANLFVSFFV